MLTDLLERLTGLTTIDHVIADAVATRPADPVFAVLRDAFGLDGRVAADDLARIPRRGPVIVVSNHPCGFAEGLVVPALLDARRSDGLTMAHTWFARWPVLARRMLLVDPQHAAPGNAAALKDAVRWLRGGGALYLCPAGEVAHAPAGSGGPLERPWRPGLATLVRLTGATVVPIHVDGTNRRRFHVLSRIHRRLGSLLLGRELLAQRGRTVAVRVGPPLAAADLRAAASPAAVVDRCREAVFALETAPAGDLPSAGRPRRWVCRPA
jgi:putative hemolysin